MILDILTSPLAFLIITLGLILSLYTWATERITEHSADSSLSPETRATIDAYLDRMETDNT